MKRFTDGSWYNVGKTVAVNIRCVRDQAPEQLNADASQEAMQAAQIEPAAGGEESIVQESQQPMTSSEEQPFEPQTAPEAYQRAIETGRHPR